MRRLVLVTGLVLATAPASEVTAQPELGYQTEVRLLAFQYDLSEYRRGGSGYGIGLEVERAWGEQWVRSVSVGLNLGVPGGMDDFEPGEWYNGQWASVTEGLELIGPGIRIRGAYALLTGAWRTSIGPELGTILCITESSGIGPRLRPMVGLRLDLGVKRVSVLARAGMFRFPVQWTQDEEVTKSFGDWRKIWEVGLAVRP